MEFDAAEDFGFVEPDGGMFPALALGAGYALYRHGQDQQTAAIIDALNRLQAPTPQEPEEVEVDITVHVDQEPVDEFDRRGVTLVNALDYVQADLLDSWDAYIGQGPLKRQMMVHMTAAKATNTRLPHTLFASGNPGVGKTTASRLVAKTMGADIIELVPPFNIYTLAEAAEKLDDGDVLFIDEIHKLSDNGKRGAEILLKLLEDGVIFLPDGDVVECADITVIGATTDSDLLPETVLDRFKIKPYFQPYTLLELGLIANAFAIRHRCTDTVETEPNDPRLYAAIARACRGIPRVTEEMIMACRALYYTLNRVPTPAEMLQFLEVEPDGMTRQHIHYITAMFKYFKRVTADGAVEYMVGEAAMMQLLRETKPGLGRLERFLIERGMIDRTPRGRRLTDKGITEAQRFLREGKGPKDVK